MFKEDDSWSYSEHHRIPEDKVQVSFPGGDELAGGDEGGVGWLVLEKGKVREGWAAVLKREESIGPVIPRDTTHPQQSTQLVSSREKCIV
jgi:hypothetical protein